MPETAQKKEKTSDWCTPESTCTEFASWCPIWDRFYKTGAEEDKEKADEAWQDAKEDLEKAQPAAQPPMPAFGCPIAPMQAPAQTPADQAADRQAEVADRQAVVAAQADQAAANREEMQGEAAQEHMNAQAEQAVGVAQVQNAQQEAAEAGQQMPAQGMPQTAMQPFADGMGMHPQTGMAHNAHFGPNQYALGNGIMQPEAVRQHLAWQNAQMQANGMRHQRDALHQNANLRMQRYHAMMAQQQRHAEEMRKTGKDEKGKTRARTVELQKREEDAQQKKEAKAHAKSDDRKKARKAISLPVKHDAEPADRLKRDEKRAAEQVKEIRDKQGKLQEAPLPVKEHEKSAEHRRINTYARGLMGARREKPKEPLQQQQAKYEQLHEQRPQVAERRHVDQQRQEQHVLPHDAGRSGRQTVRPVHEAPQEHLRDREAAMRQREPAGREQQPAHIREPAQRAGNERQPPAAAREHQPAGAERLAWDQRRREPMQEWPNYLARPPQAADQRPRAPEHGRAEDHQERQDQQPVHGQANLGAQPPLVTARA